MKLSTYVTPTRIDCRTFAELEPGDVFTFDDPNIVEDCRVNLVVEDAQRFDYVVLSDHELIEDSYKVYRSDSIVPDTKVWLLHAVVNATFQQALVLS